MTMHYNPPVFASIVEGQGEELAFRILLNKILTAQQAETYPDILRSWRVPKGTMVGRPAALESYAERAIAEAGPNGRLFLLLDADDDCPAELGPALLRRLAAQFPNHPISVNIANREYETWLIASLESISMASVIPEDSVLPERVESIRGAKEWLTERLPRGSPYNPIAHQASFTSSIDVPLARSRSQSFDRFCREVGRLLSASSIADSRSR